MSHVIVRLSGLMQVLLAGTRLRLRMECLRNDPAALASRDEGEANDIHSGADKLTGHSPPRNGAPGSVACSELLACRLKTGRDPHCAAAITTLRRAMGGAVQWCVIMVLAMLPLCLQLLCTLPAVTSWHPGFTRTSKLP
jgi:hypothetical protein